MKIFVISGQARTGKSTLGNYLRDELKEYGYKPCVMHLTEPLYGYARNYFNWDENTGEKPREFLQKMGIEIIKEKLHKNFFLIDRTCEDIEILSNFFDVFIITDARLIMEFNELKKRFDDVVTIKLVREEEYDDGLSDEERTHITETEMNSYNNFDYTVYNTGFDDMKKQVESIIKNEEM